MAQTNENGTIKSGTINSKQHKILVILKENPEGLRVNSLIKFSGIPRRTLYRYLDQFKDKKLVENIWPIWRLCQNQGDPLKMAQLRISEVQLHDVSFILKLINKPSWWDKRNNTLMKLSGFNFNKEIPWGNNKYHVLSRDNFIIQVFSNSIVLFNKKHYYGKDSYDCFIQALDDTLKVYNLLEERFNFRFFNDGIPQMTVRSQHFTKLNDAIADHCKKIGKMLSVEIDGKLRAWIDQSEPFGIEMGHRNYGMGDNKEYVDFVRDILANNPPKPSEMNQHMNEHGLLMAEMVKQNGFITQQQALIA